VSFDQHRADPEAREIWYYFDSKEGLYQAISERWRQRERDLVPPATPLPEQIRRYALEALNNPDSVRLMAWGGLEYTGPEDDPDHASRAERLQPFIDHIRAQQQAGRLAAEVDPACLTIMLMAAAMATTSLPHVIEGICGVDPRAPEFLHHYAEQLAILARLVGLDP
jgi:TetR/AcrR family transcriptional regulator